MCDVIKIRLKRKNMKGSGKWKPIKKRYFYDVTKTLLAVSLINI